MKKPRIKKLRVTGSGPLYQCNGRMRTEYGMVDRFGYGNSPAMAFQSWLTGKNLMGSFA